MFISMYSIHVLIFFLIQRTFLFGRNAYKMLILENVCLFVILTKIRKYLPILEKTWCIM